MAVTDQTPIGGAVGNGVTTVFPFAYYIGDEADLVVQRDGVNATLNVDYVVSGAGNPSGGQITFVTAPASGVKVTHFRNTSLTRTTDYQDGGDLPARTVNLDFDRLWLALQELYSGGRMSERALRVPVGEEVDELPDAASRAGLYLAFDETGQPVALPGGGGGGGPDNDLAYLANTADAAKGDALLGVKQPFTGGVARTQHEKNIDTGLFADDFRLSDDPDDTLSIQRVLNLGRTCFLRPNKTYTASGLASVAGSALVCVGGRAIIRVPTGAGKYGIAITTNGFTLAGVNFDGQDMQNYNAGAGTYGTRSGVIIGNQFGTGTSIRGITVKDVDCYGFDLAGVQGREVQIGFNFGKSVTLENVYCYRCLAGVWAAPRFEYVHAVAVNVFECYAGLILQGGNNTWIGLKAQWCFNNIQMSTGENDAHGQFIGGDCNHAYGAGFGLYAVDVVYGQTFLGMAFWYAPISMTRCTGIFITHGQIAGGAAPVTINQDFNQGGICGIDDNWTPGGLAITLVNPIHFTSFRRNRISAADMTFATTYGDVHMVSKASTSAFPIAFNASSDTAFAITFSTEKRWHGTTAAFLDYGSARAYIPRTGKYKFSISITYSNPASAEQVNMKLVRYTGITNTIADFDSASAYFPANATNCTISGECNFMAASGDTLGITLRVPSGATISITSLVARVDSVD